MWFFEELGDILLFRHKELIAEMGKEGADVLGIIFWVALVFLAATIIIPIITAFTAKKNPAVTTRTTTTIRTIDTGGMDMDDLVQGMGGTNAYFGDAPVNVGNLYYHYQPDNQPVIQRSTEQRRIVEEYFIVKNVFIKKKPVLYAALAFLATSLILLIIAFSNKEPWAWIATGVGGVITYLLFRHYSKSVIIKPGPMLTDLQYEKLVEEKIKRLNVEELGLKRLGLDPDQVTEIRPITLRDKVVAGHSLLRYDGRDKNKLHSSTQYVTLLYFTDDQIYVYKLQFDMCCDVQEEWAQEFFYKDICDISTYVSRNVLSTRLGKISYSSVKFRIIASNSSIGFEMDGANPNVDSIQAMKQKVREKKNA